MTRTRLVAGLAMATIVIWLSAGCSGPDDDNAPAAPVSPRCVELGEQCGPRGGACCQDQDGPVQCLDGTCGVCLPLQAACTGIQCCDGAPCRGGKCCSIGGCSTDADCCGGRVCSGLAGCCIPAGSPTSYNPDCCSGRAREIYCEYPNPDDGTYYCGSECL